MMDIMSRNPFPVPARRRSLIVTSHDARSYGVFRRICHALGPNIHSIVSNTAGMYGLAA